MAHDPGIMLMIVKFMTLSCTSKNLLCNPILGNSGNKGIFILQKERNWIADSKPISTDINLEII